MFVTGINLNTGDTEYFDFLNSSSSGTYKGLWDASTNTPFLTNGVGEDGDYYEVSVAGTVDFGDGDIIFAVGDVVAYSYGKWKKGDKPIINDNEISLDTTWSSSKIQEVLDSVDAKLEEDVTANIAVGGITVNQVLEEGMSFTEFVNALLVKYYPPTLTMNSNKSLLNKKGTTISQPITINAKSVKKSNNIVKTTIYFRGEEMASGTNPNGETVTYTYTSNITEDETFTSSVSDGKQTVTSSLKFEFIVPFYYGVSNSNTVSSLTGLTELLEKKGNKSVTLSPNNQYVIYMYDSSYGNLSKIIDPNGFDITPSFNRSEVTIDGQTYKCYVSNDKSTNTNFKYTFNF